MNYGMKNTTVEVVTMSLIQSWLKRDLAGERRAQADPLEQGHRARSSKQTLNLWVVILLCFNSAPLLSALGKSVFEYCYNMRKRVRGS